MKHFRCHPAVLCILLALSFGIQQYSFAVSGDGSSSDPYVTSQSGGSYDFNNVSVGSGSNYFDPEPATHYFYEVTTGPLIAAVELFQVNIPSNGIDKDFFINFPGNTGAPIPYTAAALFPFSSPFTVIATPFVFPFAVTSFGVTGIDPSAMLDLTDPTAFVTGIEFVFTGPTAFVTLEMTPNLPEPSSLVLFGISLLFVLLALAWRRRKQTT